MQNVGITLPTAISNTRHAFINITRLRIEILRAIVLKAVIFFGGGSVSQAKLGNNFSNFEVTMTRGTNLMQQFYLLL